MFRRRQFARLRRFGLVAHRNCRLVLRADRTDGARETRSDESGEQLVQLSQGIRSELFGYVRPDMRFAGAISCWISPVQVQILTCRRTPGINWKRRGGGRKRTPGVRARGTPRCPGRGRRLWARRVPRLRRWRWRRGRRSCGRRAGRAPRVAGRNSSVHKPRLLTAEPIAVGGVGGWPSRVGVSGAGSGSKPAALRPTGRLVPYLPGTPGAGARSTSEIGVRRVR
jgi:hypothetical protein